MDKSSHYSKRCIWSIQSFIAQLHFESTPHQSWKNPRWRAGNLLMLSWHFGLEAVVVCRIPRRGQVGMAFHYISERNLSVFFLFFFWNCNIKSKRGSWVFRDHCCLDSDLDQLTLLRGLFDWLLAVRFSQYCCVRFRWIQLKHCVCDRGGEVQSRNNDNAQK